MLHRFNQNVNILITKYCSVPYWHASASLLFSSKAWIRSSQTGWSFRFNGDSCTPQCYSNWLVGIFQEIKLQSVCSHPHSYHFCTLHIAISQLLKLCVFVMIGRTNKLASVFLKSILNVGLAMLSRTVTPFSYFAACMMLRLEQINNRGFNFKVLSLRQHRWYILTSQIHKTISEILKY